MAAIVKVIMIDCKIEKCVILRDVIFLHAVHVILLTVIKHALICGNTLGVHAIGSIKRNL